jgi:hypothetical protein
LVPVLLLAEKLIEQMAKAINPEAVSIYFSLIRKLNGD